MLARITASGEFDPSYGGDVAASLGMVSIDAIAFSRDGDPLLAGSTTDARGNSGVALVRLRSDGTRKESFGRDGLRFLAAPGPPDGLVVDRQERILVQSGSTVLRLNARGRVDRGFGRHGRATVKLPDHTELSSIAVDSRDGVLLAGTLRAPDHTARGFTATRLSASGMLDRSFGRDGWIATRFGRNSSAAGGEALIDYRGRLVLGGAAMRPDLQPTGGFAIARYRLNR